MDLSGLGQPTGPMVRVAGGFANSLYRLDTEQGSFSVKELTLGDRREGYDSEAVFRFERAAFAAGIPMPEPISAGDGIVVHRWVEGEKLPEAPVSPEYGFAIGRILARIHALDHAWPHAPIEQPAERDWPELALRATATRQPWADELSARVASFLAITDLVDNCDRLGPIVLTHKDIHPWNLLTRDRRPVLLDWELSGKLDLAGELGSTALSLAKGPGFDQIVPTAFRSIVDGYVDQGGELPPSGLGWFAYTLRGWLVHTRLNVLRCLSGSEATTGPNLELSHKIVSNGLRGLPELYSRLPRLQALLP